MAKPTAPTPEHHPLHIELPEELSVDLLVDAIRTHNGLVQHGLFDLYPPDLNPKDVHQHLVDHLTSLGQVTHARSKRATAVAKRGTALKQAQPLYDRVIGMVELTFPHGSEGRADFYPRGNTSPQLGDLLIAAGEGVRKHGKPKLPDGITADDLVQLGALVRTVQVERDNHEAKRKGHSNVAATLTLRTREIRGRLRGLVVRFFGSTHQKLMDFGITPAKPRGGARRKKKDKGPE